MGAPRIWGATEPGRDCIIPGLEWSIRSDWKTKEHRGAFMVKAVAKEPRGVALILQAAAFAAHKHRDQRRKDHAASPYINHPITLAEILSGIGGVRRADVLAAALLHDTLEDT